MNKFLRCIIFSVLFLTYCPCYCHDQWIVCTTIFYPTDALKQLCDQASEAGWKVVVVGDKKTPDDWEYDGVIFLGIEEQERLGYEILQHLPFNHYCRKNIGYLYAIEQGATVIYETDDDNFITDFESISKRPSFLNFLTSEHDTVNVYHYFGQPDVWPRGLPLEEIVNSGDYSVESKKVMVDIVQGLVNKDPDVDAIFRLTQGREVQFNQMPPCALEKGLFCPFNTQNTTFYPRAFFGLLIPSTTSFRVCDIWRGLMTQRMLWEIDSHLCFQSATAYQERNDHNLLKDFDDELQMYLYSGKLIKYLNDFIIPQQSFENKYLQLYENLYQQGFIKFKDVMLLRAWVRDLKKVGYVFPGDNR